MFVSTIYKSKYLYTNIYIYIYVDVSSHPFHQGTCWSSYPPAWYETQWPAHLAVAALWPFAGRGCWWSHWTCGPWDWHQGDPTWNKLGIWIFSRAIGSIGFWMEFIEVHGQLMSHDVNWTGFLLSWGCAMLVLRWVYNRIRWKNNKLAVCQPNGMKIEGTQPPERETGF